MSEMQNFSITKNIKFPKLSYLKNHPIFKILLVGKFSNFRNFKIYKTKKISNSEIYKISKFGESLFFLKVKYRPKLQLKFVKLKKIRNST